MHIGDLGERSVEFAFAFFTAFALYLLAVVLLLRCRWPISVPLLVLIFGFAIVFRAVLVFTPPTLSDDMYRYVWDGRVQANGINPYAYPPDGPELSHLRDASVWPFINRKGSVTVYPAGAQLAYGALWRIWPDSLRWFKVAMTTGDLLAGVVLILLLRALERPAHLALIYLWSPLVIFETAHSAHVDGLVLPLLIGAWLFIVKARDSYAGLFLGAATSLKLYPAVLLPALCRSVGSSRRLRSGLAMPLAFVSIIAVTYVPFLALGSSVIGYLPQYLGESFNGSLARIFIAFAALFGLKPEGVVVGLEAAILAVIGLRFWQVPAENGEQAIRRCIWPIGTFVLLTHNLYPWYVLWLVPLLALFLQPGRLGLRLDAWTGWLLFTGSVALSYLYGISWITSVEFAPLYMLLIFPALRGLVKRGYKTLR